MKKVIFGLIASLMIGNLTFSQSKIDILTKEITQSTEFDNLFKNLELFNSLKKDKSIIESLIKKDKLNEDERQNLATALGFSNIDEAYKFEKENYENINALKNKYKLDKLSQNDLSLLFSNSFNSKVASSGTIPMGNCGGRLANCRTSSYAVYGIELTGCAAAGIGIGTATFWCAGCVGAGVAGLCVSAATAHLGTMLSDCNYDYLECMGK